MDLEARWSKQAHQQESPLLFYGEYRQSPLHTEDVGPYDLRYEIIDAKVPALSPFVQKSLVNARQDEVQLRHARHAKAETGARLGTVVHLLDQRRIRPTGTHAESHLRPCGQERHTGDTQQQDLSHKPLHSFALLTGTKIEIFLS